MTTDRLRQGDAATLTATWYDGEDVADPGTVTVTVVRADGTSLASAAATSGSGEAARTYQLSAADTSVLSVLTATWTSSTLGARTTRHQVAGGFYLELADIRALDGLDNTTRHTTAELERARAWFEDLAEQWCRVAFVPRYGRRDSYHRWGADVYLAPLTRSIQAATLDGTAFSTALWDTTDDGYVVGDRPPGSGRLVVHYTHGYDEPDVELVEAAKTAIRSKLLTDQSGMPSRQLLLSNELGTVRLAQPGPKAATGIPEVDRVLNDRRFHPALIG